MDQATRSQIFDTLAGASLTVAEVAEQVGCSTSSVHRALKSFGAAATFTPGPPKRWSVNANALSKRDPGRPGRPPEQRDVIARYLYEHPRSRTVDVAFACSLGESSTRRTLHSWPSWFIPERGFRHTRWRLTPAQNEAQRDQAVREGWR